MPLVSLLAMSFLTAVELGRQIRQFNCSIAQFFHVFALGVFRLLERLGNGPFQRRILIAAGLCFAADSMEILLLSFLTVILQAEWDMTEAQTNSIISSVFVGALVGTLTLGSLGDRIGRKPVFTATAAIICVFGFLTAICNTVCRNSMPLVGGMFHRKHASSVPLTTFIRVLPVDPKQQQ